MTKHEGPEPPVGSIESGETVPGGVDPPGSDGALGVAATEAPSPEDPGELVVDETLPATAGVVADYDMFGVVDPDHYAQRAVLTHGGMGRIVRARDRRLRRTVAIKELRADNPELRARFEREALLTARLQHPSIVSIHEAGRWPSGEPFYAMKLVPGRSLDKAISAARSLEQRLALLPHVIAVADALAYAHSEHVIHRDLKPGNVMVGEFGETVVIDWGLAKDLDGTAVGAEPAAGPYRTSEPPAVETIVGEVLGTPAYMPPEQAAGEPVDERADVYSIGAILYHLLAGAAPYGGSTSAEVLAAVKRGPPSRLGERQEHVAPDLLAIVDRAMARHPEARYPTARELADDLRRFQAGQLVGAHQYSLRQLLRRWLRRYRTAVAVAAVAGVVLAVVGAISVRRIVREERRANQQRALAAEHRAEAEDLMDFMVFDLKDRLEPMGRLDLLETVARKANDYYAGRSELDDDAERHRRGAALINIGDVLRTQGDVTAALRAYREALGMAQQLVDAEPGNQDWQRDLARRRDGIGDLLINQGDTKGALAEYNAALRLRTQLADASPGQPELVNDVAYSHGRIAGALRSAGDMAAAVTEYQTALGLRQTLAARDPAWQRALATSHVEMGKALAEQGRRDDALAQYSAALELRRAIASREPADSTVQEELSSSLLDVGDALRWKGDTDGASAKHRDALAIKERLASSDPTNALRQQSASIARSRIGDDLLRAGDAKGALDEYRKALAIEETLVAQHPANAQFQRSLSGAHQSVADALIRTGDPKGAVEQYRAALAVMGQLRAEEPDQARWQGHVASLRNGLGGALMATGDSAGALQEYRAALAISERQSAANPGTESYHVDVLMARYTISRVLLARDDPRGALGVLEAAAVLAEELRAKDPSHPAWPRMVLALRNSMGNIRVELDELEAGIADFEAARAIAVDLAASDPQMRGDVASIGENLGDALLERGDPGGALKAYQAALAVDQEIAADQPADQKTRAAIAQLRAKIGHLPRAGH